MPSPDDEDAEADPVMNDLNDDSEPTSGQRKSLPEWLTELVAEKLEFLKQTDSQGCPTLYSKLGTFWLLHKSGWFNMLSSKKLKPELLYNPWFFYWDPLYLVEILCPHCKAKLKKHGTAYNRPRECFDVNGSFWIIGARYRCPDCINPKSGKKSKTFMSWNSEILKSLPKALAAEFPCELTHRSGMSKSTSALHRGLVSTGLGNKQISDLFQMKAKLKHTQLQIQYHEMVHSLRDKLPWNNAPFPAFSSFEDPDGFSGHIPGSQWFRDRFDCYIERHISSINQFTAMLSAHICAIDHSHKITKHIVSVNGVPVFIGLLTVTNERGEIRVLALVATKAHAQFEIALTEMSRSLEKYGHSQPVLFYTDNISDRPFLERSLPALRANVQPFDKYAKFPPLSLPDKMVVVVKSTPTQIQDALGTIQQDVIDSSDSHATVGLDVMWDVNIEAGHAEQRKPAVIAIAYKMHIYILQIAHLVARDNFPIALKNFLLDHNVVKVGHRIKSDLKRLQSSAKSVHEFPNYIDLASYAKARRVVSNATVGLAELSALVLNRYMHKDPEIQLNTQWETRSLSDKQKQHLALDVYAKLCIYNQLEKIPLSGPIPDNPPAGLPVALYQEDGCTLIAYGHWSDKNILSNAKVDGITITKTRAAIEVTQVIVKGAIIGLQQKSLEEFGATPFTIVCKRKQLQTSSEIEQSLTKDAQTESILSQAAADQANTSSHSSNSDQSESAQEILESWIRDADTESEHHLYDVLRCCVCENTHLN